MQATPGEGKEILGNASHELRTPLVLMPTAAGARGDRVSGLALGADDHLAKPFHFPELILRIRSPARRRPTARARTLRAAGLELDPVRRTALPDGRPLELSVKAFAVLEALLRAGPVFLSTEKLLEQVWDETADPFTDTVTVTIGRVRRKLGSPPVITTTPGVGCRITAAPTVRQGSGRRPLSWRRPAPNSAGAGAKPL